ncbi:MAG: hypothetical protein AB1480_06360 [Nitrospirota bacterium]
MEEKIDSENEIINTKDWVIDRARNFCERHSKWSGIAGAFLAGSFVNVWTDPNVQTWSVLLNRLFDVQTRPLNVLSWFAVFIILFLSVGRYSLQWYSRKRSYNIRLAELYRDKVDLSLQPFQRGRIAWGLGLTLQSCPDLHAGWLMESVRIQHDTTQYVVPKEWEDSYKKYVDTVFRGKDDRTRLMIVENPIAFSDAPTLQLRVQETKYSHVQFFHRWMKQDLNQRTLYTDRILKSQQVNFPNSLCLHLVVVTNDGYLLLTQITNKSDYYPDQWACSIAEQLDLKDLTGPDEKFALNWVERTLWEELGISNVGFNPKNVRVMAVFLEGDIANFALAALVLLKLDRSELNAIIDKHPRTDYEFQDWTFISWDEIPNELLKPTRIYHPTTGIRMFYAGLFKFGAPGLNRQLMKLRKK